MQEQNRVTNGTLVEQQSSDAYCEICQKELCNKYYLATHRRLKHFPSPLALSTMISQDSMPQNVDINALFGLGEPNKLQNLQNLYMNPQSLGNGGSPSPSSQPSSGAASTVANGENAPETPSKAATPVAPDLNVQSILASFLPSMAHQNNVQHNMQQILEQMATMNGMNPLVNFNPLAALQSGALLMGGSPTKMKPKEQMKGGPPNPLHFAFPFSLTPSTSTASQQSVIVANDGDLTPPQKRIKIEDDDPKQCFESIINSLTSGTTTCNECGKDFDNPLELMSHRANEHDKKVVSPTAYSCPDCDKSFASPQYLETHRLTQHTPMAQRILSMPPGFPFGLLPPMGQQFGMPDFDPTQVLGSMSTPKHINASMKKSYMSNGKNYCDLCNKEVCNKYFLRTHMLKMHGIVIDENKTVIGNVDTLEKERQGQLTFRCDSCHIELKTRQQLREHKQTAHNILPLAPARNTMPSKPSLSQLQLVPGSFISQQEESKCPACEKRCPQEQMKHHIQTEHPGDLVSFIMSQLPSSSPSFDKDGVDLQALQMSVHPVELLKDPSKNDPSLLRCNQCQYRTKEQKNLEMHQERHERMNDAKTALGQEIDEDVALQMTAEVALQMARQNKYGEPVFKCGVCSTVYPDEASLDAHAAVDHAGLNLTVPKKEADPEKILERNSHTSGSLSPSSESLPEGYIKASQDKSHVMQSFVLRISEPHGHFVGELVAQLPVKSLVSGPARLTVEAIPQ